MTNYFPENQSDNPSPSHPSFFTRLNYDGIEIEGNDVFCGRIVAALELLKISAPDYYTFVLDEVRLIRQFQRSGTNVESGRCIVDLSEVTVSPSVTWTACVIVHESVHNWQYRNYMVTQGLPVAPDAYSGVTAELECIAVQLRALKLIGGPEWEIAHLEAQDGRHFDLDGDGDYDWDDYYLRIW